MPLTCKSALSGLAALALALGASVTATPAAAQDPFVGEIRPFGYNFCPRGWASAAGQLLPISQNDALFSLYGTIYGGDGRTTFALPDLRGRSNIHNGTGPGLSRVQIGERGGQETVTLILPELPSHNHTVFGGSGAADTTVPTSALPSAVSSSTGGRVSAYNDSGPNTTMSTTSVGQAGGSMAHENMSPFIAITWCVALVGVYPSRN